MSETKTTSSDTQNLQRKAVVSKIRGLTEHLQALLQKKIRLDIEIRKTKQKLTKLKANSSFEMKISSSLEQELPRSTDPFKQFQIYLERAESEQLDQEIQETLDLTEFVLEEYSRLEPYLIDQV